MRKKSAPAIPKRLKFPLTGSGFLNVVKDSKKGLSRTALVMAATGKSEGAAKNDGQRSGDAGEVIAHIIEQSPDIGRLLNPETNRRYHLSEIKQAPASTWQLLTGLLVENTWSVKDTKAAVDRVIGLTTSCPKWLSGIHADLKKPRWSLAMQRPPHRHSPSQVNCTTKNPDSLAPKGFPHRLSRLSRLVSANGGCLAQR